MAYYKVNDAFNQIANAAAQMGVTFQEATEAFRSLAQMGHTMPSMSDMIEFNTETNNRINALAEKVYVLDSNAQFEAVCSTNLIVDEISELKEQINDLRTEMGVLTEKPKRKVDLEIFEQIFDNSDFPLLESDIFPEIDFNINI